MVKKRELEEGQRRKFRQQSREDIKSLNITWVEPDGERRTTTRVKKCPCSGMGILPVVILISLYQQQLLDIIH